MEPLRVTYRTSLDGELRAFMTKQLIKYLLFMRNQIPCLYDDLLQFVESYQLQQQEQAGGSRRRRLPLSGGFTKAVKCVEVAEKLFSVQLDTIFTLEVKRVALVFGASFMSPREVVIVDFDQVETEEQDAEHLSQSTAASPQTDQDDTSLEDSQTQTLPPPSPPMAKEKLMRLCSQKLMRTVFTHAMEHFSSALSATKMHVAVLAERHPGRILGFVPKQQFKLRLPRDKCGERTHYVAICGGVDSNKQSQPEHLQQSGSMQDASDNTNSMGNEARVASTGVNNEFQAPTNDAGMLWYVLEKPIPGFSQVIGLSE